MPSLDITFSGQSRCLDFVPFPCAAGAMQGIAVSHEWTALAFVVDKLFLLVANPIVFIATVPCSGQSGSLNLHSFSSAVTMSSFLKVPLRAQRGCRDFVLFPLWPGSSVSMS